MMEESLTSSTLFGIYFEYPCKVMTNLFCVNSSLILILLSATGSFSGSTSLLLFSSRKVVRTFNLGAEAFVSCMFTRSIKRPIRLFASKNPSYRLNAIIITADTTAKTTEAVITQW